MLYYLLIGLLWGMVMACCNMCNIKIFYLDVNFTYMLIIHLLSALLWPLSILCNLCIYIVLTIKPELIEYFY